MLLTTLVVLGIIVIATSLPASRPAQVPSRLPGSSSGQVEGPDDHPGTSVMVAPSHRIARPSAVPPRSSAAPTDTPRTAKPSAALAPAISEPILVAGVATWFDSPSGVSAAGPALRAALGPGWRGRRVTVCMTGDGPATRCVETVLGDWCACGDRNGTPTVIDLNIHSFVALAPKSYGVIRVEVYP